MIQKRKSFFYAVLLLVTNAYAENINYQRYFKEPFVTPANCIHKMTPENVGAYYKMLQVVDDVLNQHNITYWISGGTLLGAVRHGGMIPWDDDADIELFAYDKEKVISLNSVFNSFGYRVADWSWGDGLRIYPIKSNYPKIDIFLTKQVDDKVVLETGHFPKCFWFITELTPIARIAFGPIQLNCPNQVMRYFYSCYGKDVMTHARVRPNGDRYTIIDFSPAEYTW